MRQVLAASLIALVAGPSLAADGDMKVGTFGYTFCGARATFEVQSQQRGSWNFKGKIRIHDTGEYDNLRITQYDDNSLKITRYLSGRNIGETQTVNTTPPTFDAGMAVFYSSGGRGVGCNNRGAVTQLNILP